MENLPDEILAEIFSHLDSESMWNAMKVCNAWFDIFKNYHKLLEKLQLEITEDLLDGLTRLDSPKLTNIDENPLKVDENLPELTEIDENPSKMPEMSKIFPVKLEVDEKSPELVKNHPEKSEVEENFPEITENDKNLLKIYENHPKKLETNQNLPNLPIKSIRLSDLKFFQSKKSDVWQNYDGDNKKDNEFRLEKRIQLENLIKILKKYENSVERLEISGGNMNLDFLTKILNEIKNLKHLKCENLQVIKHLNISTVKLPNLQSISLSIGHHQRFNIKVYFEIFKSNENVRKLEIKLVPIILVKNQDFDEFLLSFPKLNHLILKGQLFCLFLDRQYSGLKIEKLEVYGLKPWKPMDPNLQFLASQMGNLKELHMDGLQMSKEGGMTFKFIIEEMKLETFSYCGIQMIKNSQKQPIQEISFNMINFYSGIEIIRQFPSIKKLTFELPNFGAPYGTLMTPLNVETEIFYNIQQLEIKDDDKNLEFVADFIRNCRFIKKLTIQSKLTALNEVFRESFIHLINLTEINLDCAEICFEAIKNCCGRLKKLNVNSSQVKNAKIVFSDTDVAVGSL